MKNRKASEEYLMGALEKTVDGMNELTNWSVWSGDLLLEDVLKLKKHFLILERRIREIRGK